MKGRLKGWFQQGRKRLYWIETTLSDGLRPLQKALPPTAETQTQVFGRFRLPQSLLILPKYPLNPPRIPHNQAFGPHFKRQQAHLAC